MLERGKFLVQLSRRQLTNPAQIHDPEQSRPESLSLRILDNNDRTFPRATSGTSVSGFSGREVGPTTEQPVDRSPATYLPCSPGIRESPHFNECRPFGIQRDLSFSAPLAGSSPLPQRFYSNSCYSFMRHDYFSVLKIFNSARVLG